MQNKVNNSSNMRMVLTLSWSMVGWWWKEALKNKYIMYVVPIEFGRCSKSNFDNHTFARNIPRIFDLSIS